MAYQPLRDLMLVKLDPSPDELTASGLVIPTASQAKSTTGTIMAIGPGKLSATGERLPLTVAVGDKVILGKGSGQEIKVEGQELLIVREDDIMVVLK